MNTRMKARGEKCLVDGCQRERVAKGLCKRHYYNAKNASNRAANPRPPRPIVNCAMRGCGGKAVCKGMCQKHYVANRLATNLDVAAQRKRSRNTYYRANKQVFLDREKQLRLEKPELVKARKAAYHIKNAAAINANRAAWDKVNPEKARVAWANKRASRRGAVGSYSAEEIAELFLKQRGRCAVCRCAIVEGKYHKDHIIPIARGGTNNIENIQLLCKTCNLEKHAKHPVDFMQEKGFLL